jgi:hypothetical protein
MKNKNRISKLLVNAIISAILGAVIGSLVTIFAQLTVEKLPIDPIYIVLFFAALVTVLAIMILFKIETIEEYRYEIMNDLVDGFIKIEKGSISDFATSLVKKSSFVRVVGTARQDVLNSKNRVEATKYLKSLEEKLKKKSQSENDGFTYYRVVPKAIKIPLEEHIKVCMKNAEKTGNTFDFKEVESFDFYISYQIFDDSDLLLIADNKSHTGKSDNALCLWTRNKEIIRTFIYRFDNAWNGASSII